MDIDLFRAVLLVSMGAILLIAGLYSFIDNRQEK
jgi:hypothetical protein